MSDGPTELPRPLDAPTAVGGLIAYQEGAVVSRTLVKVTGGSLTLFAFDAGQGISEHTTPHEAVVHVVDGSAEVAIDGEVVSVAAGEAIRLPADVPHAVAAPARFKMLLAMFRTAAGA